MATADAHGIVPVLFSCLVCNNLHTVKLKDCAGYSLASSHIEDARHAHLGRDSAGPMRKGFGILETFKSCGLGSRQSREVRIVVETIGLGPVN